MSKFPVHTLETAPELAVPLLEAVNKKFAMIPALFAVMANSPKFLQYYLTASEIFSATSFSNTEQQIILITTSAFNGCTYCVAAHSSIADMIGVPAEVTNSVRSDTKLNDPKLEALRQITKQIVQKRGWLSDEEITEFLSAGYDQSALLNVIAGVSLKTASNYMNHITKTPLEPAFEARAWTSFS